MLPNHSDLSIPNQPPSEPKPALQASVFSIYFFLFLIKYNFFFARGHIAPNTVFLLPSWPFSPLYFSESLRIPLSVSLWLYRYHYIYGWGCVWVYIHTQGLQLFVQLLSLLAFFSLEHGLRTTARFHVSVPQRSLYSGPSYTKLEAWIVLCEHKTMYRGDLISRQS